MRRPETQTEKLKSLLKRLRRAPAVPRASAAEAREQIRVLLREEVPGCAGLCRVQGRGKAWLLWSFRRL